MLINDIENDKNAPVSVDDASVSDWSDEWETDGNEDKSIGEQELISSSADNRLTPTSATWINTDSVENPDDGAIVSGTVLCNEYRVLKPMNVNTGEASLYTCVKADASSDTKYVAKVYRRLHSVKPEVTQKLLSMNSPYVAPLYLVGEHRGFSVEIIPYYAQGSLAGATISADDLKNFVIPALNEGLHALHTNGIIHKDIKPSNIMLNDTNDGVVLIDFGISSVKGPESTVVVTQTGMTPEYSAPETFRNIFLEESDYYSMGITIYELFCGTTPFKASGASPFSGMGEDEIAQLAFTNKLPFPPEMPKELQDLISGLTYFDISNRKDKSNPDRRWTYDDVRAWLDGTPSLLPGDSGFNPGAMPVFDFGGNQYDTLDGIINALASDWEQGKNAVFGKRDLLKEYFDKVAPAKSRICENATASVHGGADPDVAFSKLLGDLSPSSPALYWKGSAYASAKKLGECLFDLLEKDSDTSLESSLISSGALDAYFERVYSGNNEAIDAASSVRKMLTSAKNDSAAKAALYAAAYLTTGYMKIKIADMEFASVDEIAAYMRSLADSSFDALREFAYSLVDVSLNVCPQLKGWALVTDRTADIEAWETKFGMKGKAPSKKSRTKQNP